ncbi:MAG: hypothetical protein IID05_09965, partial [Gemmatimonadetes bacterium]|nr:hypothetical protein [Gemmatimonadota bacterium]
MIDKLSQDERIVRFSHGTIIRGLDVSGQDSQSEAGTLLPRIDADLVDYCLRDLFSVYIGNVSGSGWVSAEPVDAIESSVDRAEQEAEDELEIAHAEELYLSPDRLASEILKSDTETDLLRLRELVLLAEDTDFSLEQSSLLAPRLLELATQYRASNDSQDAPIVWSAIRTGASMLHPHEANRLLPLLEPGHPIETSLVALKMLGRIFEAQPPERPDQHKDLAGKVRRIAESLLNRYAITSSQSAAMAQLAVYALAAMASNETLNIVHSVRRLGVSWFTQQIARELRELRDSWDARSVPA